MSPGFEPNLLRWKCLGQLPIKHNHITCVFFVVKFTSFSQTVPLGTLRLTVFSLLSRVHHLNLMLVFCSIAGLQKTHRVTITTFLTSTHQQLICHLAFFFFKGLFLYPSIYLSSSLSLNISAFSLCFILSLMQKLTISLCIILTFIQKLTISLCISLSCKN